MMGHCTLEVFKLIIGKILNLNSRMELPLLAPNIPAMQQAPSTFMPSAYKRESPVGFGELEWFANIDLFHDQMPKRNLTAAEVPELPASLSSNAAVHRPNKFCNISLKKPRIELSDHEEYLTAADLG